MYIIPMRGITLSLIVAFLSLGCSSGEVTLPAISPVSLGLPVLSNIGNNIGEVFEFNWTTPENEEGKYSPSETGLLIFWRYGCESCIVELEYIQTFHEENDIPILVVCLNDIESIPMVVVILEDMDVTFEIISDPTQELRIPYVISSVPDSLLVSAGGEIIARKRASINAETLPFLIQELK
jgi:thiol-disulfide isomerase/thioredoxin